jgi:DNA repair exonuclease SbcCD ATPase subunit
MDMVTLSLFVILELAVLLGAVVFVLNQKRKQLQAQVQALTAEAGKSTPEVFDSIASGYLPYLEKLILESREQLESSDSEAEPDSALTEAINYRLLLLEAEKKVTERSNDYPENHWQHITEFFTPPEAPEPEQVDTAGESPEDDDALDKAQERIKRLEKFRDNFFSMKKQLQELEDSKHKLAEQLEALIPEAERSEELKALLETMSAQRERLEDELAQLESQSDELAKAASQNTPTEEEQQRTETENEETESELTAQIDKQKKKIFELHHLVDDLHLEAEKSEALQAKIDQFDLANRDMNMCLQVLEENQFLQEQIKSLLQLDEGKSVYDSDEPDNDDTELQQQLETFQTALKEKDQQIKSLEEKYASMEQEYLTLYEEANS